MLSENLPISASAVSSVSRRDRFQEKVESHLSLRHWTHVNGCYGSGVSKPVEMPEGETNHQVDLDWK